MKNNSKMTNKQSKINLVLNITGVLFIVAYATYLFKNPLMGIFGVLAGISLLPKTYEFINKYVNIKKLNIILPIVLILITGMLTPENLTSDQSNSKDVLQQEAIVTPEIKEENQEPLKTEDNEVANQLEIHFINTGQSDAILLKSANSYMLIDSGDTSTDTIVEDYLKNAGVKELEYLLITHFDADHVGGADTVISDFDVKTTLVPNGDADTKAYQNFITALSSKGYNASVPLENVQMKLGDAYFEVYNSKGGYSDANDNSLIVLITNGNDKLLFTGDASSTVEDSLNIGDIDLLKVSHHGSKTGTSNSFLDKVQPEIAVICVGKDNTYGHPNQEVMDKLQMREIPVYRTDENGDILFISSGNGISTQNSQGSYSTGNVEKSISTPTPTPISTPKPTPTPKPVATPVPEQPKQEENVQQDTSYQTNFANCTELKKVYPDGVGQDHPAYRSKMDRDKDGWACE